VIRKKLKRGREIKKERKKKSKRERETMIERKRVRKRIQIN
jgi:hypothetical protein